MPPDKTEKSILVDVYQELGLLRGEVNELLRERGYAADGRKEIHRKIDHVEDCLHKKIDEIKDTLRPLAGIIERLQPVVEDLERQRQQAIGAVWIIRALMLGGAAIVGAVMGVVAKKFGWG